MRSPEIAAAAVLGVVLLVGLVFAVRDPAGPPRAEPNESLQYREGEAPAAGAGSSKATALAGGALAAFGAAFLLTKHRRLLR